MKVACKVDSVKSNKVISYQIDLSAPTTFQNWITDLNLVCEEPYKIGLIGALSFISFAIGSAFITKLADVSGRRPVIIVSSIVTPLCLLIMLTVTTSLNAIYILIFLMGLTYNSRGSTSYLFGCEFLQKKQQLFFCQVNFCLIGVSQIIAALIFKVTRSQDLWFMFLLVSITLAIAWVTFFAPESPLFLLSKRRFDDLEKSLSVVAKINGCYNEEQIKEIVENLKVQNQITT